MSPQHDPSLGVVGRTPSSRTWGSRCLVRLLVALAGSLVLSALGAQVGSPGDPRDFSGVYPHLALFNQGGECGIGAVVPWAGRLWVVTYSPHKPTGSDDKLYAVADDLSLTIRPESVGGTPANRMIHRESRQLMIGPYFIDAAGNVRVVPYTKMPGRPTATTRHLEDPANKVYVASMEEGVYEVDVHSLAVREIYPDSHSIQGANDSAMLPGYHGKGAYVSQQRLVYANNGERIQGRWTFKHIPSGSLGEWDGKDWRVVERHQFCEVTGPGGIHGAATDAEPIWATGWDRRSLILKLLDDGEWHTYRLPKASHTYDAYHGWYTEWPRIREVHEGRYLLTMHGMLWDFPGGFRRAASGGIRPLSSYLKIIGDFCFWKDRIVFGCDDAARIGNPLCGQSQSGLWFVDPKDLTQFGPSIGRGAVWLSDAVAAGVPSDPYLFAGFERRCVHLTHNAGQAVTFTFETDRAGRDEWETLHSIQVPAEGYAFHLFKSSDQGEWIRVRTDTDCAQATAFFQYAPRPNQSTKVDARLRTLASVDPDGPISVGVIRPRGEDLRTLHFAAKIVNKAGDVEAEGYYEIGADLRLAAVDDPTAHAWLKEHARVKTTDFEVDAASVILQAADGRRYRLPRGESAFDRLPENLALRGVREVVTERSLLNCRGTFYELPRSDAGGVAKIRPVCTHDRLVSDFCSWRGMLVLAGTRVGAEADSQFVPSVDGHAGLWLGTVDDLWKLGKPRGRGGPWLDTSVRPGEVSDPYLMTGYDRKRLELSHDADATAAFKVEVDLNGEGLWREYATFDVAPGKRLRFRFPTGYNAYWLRVSIDRECRATAQLEYR